MNLKFGDYLLTTGWGGKGFYDLDKAIGIETPSTDRAGIYYDLKRPIIPPEAIVCGTGSGYEEFLFQEDICEKMIISLD